MLARRRLSTVLSLALLGAVVPTLVAATGSPATAETAAFAEPAGDGRDGDRLDIDGLRLDNASGRVVVDVSFVQAAYGDMAIYLRPVERPVRSQVRIVSRHRADGDRNEVATADGRVACPGLRVDWNDDADAVRVVLPARCLNGGDYDDLQLRMITERGRDTDLAPVRGEGRWPWSRAVARG